MATSYYHAHSPAWGHPKHAAQWRASVLGLTATGKPTDHDYCRALRSLPVAQIDTPLILHVLRPLWHDKPETMSRVRARVAAVLDYAKAAGFRSGDNPAAQSVIGKLLPARGKIDPVEHYKAVDYHAVPAVLAELRKRDGTAARALEFLVITAARTSEVLRATWSEIDLDEKLWVIPPARMKAGKEHRVPLAGAALELLAQLPREAGNDFLFLAPQTGRPWSATALRTVMQRLGRSEVPHGFRSSFSDWAHERTAHSNHAIELSLAHSIGAAAEKAYRRGDMLEEAPRVDGAVGKVLHEPTRGADGQGCGDRRGAVMTEGLFTWEWIRANLILPRPNDALPGRAGCERIAAEFNRAFAGEMLPVWQLPHVFWAARAARPTAIVHDDKDRRRHWCRHVLALGEVVRKELGAVNPNRKPPFGYRARLSYRSWRGPSR